MKSKVKLFFSSLALVLTMTSFQPTHANAVMIVSLLETGHTLESHSFGQSVFMTIVCFYTLPLCLLNQKADGSNNVAIADLAANGYNDKDMGSILVDQAEMSKRLSARNLIWRIAPTDTIATVTSEVRRLYPQASQAYINFILDSAGIRN